MKYAHRFKSKLFLICNLLRRRCTTPIRDALAPRRSTRTLELLTVSYQSRVASRRLLSFGLDQTCSSVCFVINAVCAENNFISFLFLPFAGLREADTSKIRNNNSAKNVWLNYTTDSRSRSYRVCCNNSVYLMKFMDAVLFFNKIIRSSTVWKDEILTTSRSLNSFFFDLLKHFCLKFSSSTLNFYLCQW